MNNVVQLQTPKIGDHTFMVCGCQPKDPQPFVPIILLQQNPVVVGLMCPLCQQHLMVVDGVIKQPIAERDPSLAELTARAERELGEADLDHGC